MCTDLSHSWLNAGVTVSTKTTCTTHASCHNVGKWQDTGAGFATNQAMYINHINSITIDDTWTGGPVYYYLDGNLRLRDATYNHGLHSYCESTTC